MYLDIHYIGWAEHLFREHQIFVEYHVMIYFILRFSNSIEKYNKAFFTLGIQKKFNFTSGHIGRSVEN